MKEPLTILPRDAERYSLAEVFYDFLESEYMETDLKSQIKSSRKVSIAGTKVTYDTTNGVDFSKPRKTAEAFAEVLLRKMFQNGSRTPREN